MEESVKLILEKVSRIERVLVKVNNEMLSEYLDDVNKKDIIGVNNKLLYESFINNTGSNITQSEFTRAIKKKFGLRLRHTSKDKKSVYFWSE